MQPARIGHRPVAGIGDCDRRGERRRAGRISHGEAEIERIKRPCFGVARQFELNPVGLLRSQMKHPMAGKPVKREWIGLPVDTRLAVARPADDRKK